MAWLYVPGLAGSSSEPSSCIPSIEPSVTSRGKPFAPRTWSAEWKKGSWIRLLSGLTCEPSTVAHGVARWISSLPERRASHLAQPAEGEKSLQISSQKYGESRASAVHGSSSWRMFPGPSGSKAPRDFKRWALWKLRPPPWVRRMTGLENSYLPTPTAKANHCAPSMAKWPAYAAFHRLLLGAKNPPPMLWEEMMGLPIGWTACEPLETELFQQWRHAHSASS